MPDLAILSVAEIDLQTFLLNVIETRTRRGFFRNHVTQVEKSYLFDVQAGGFFDGATFVMPGSDRSWQLWTAFMAWRGERKLDHFIELDASPPRYLLPPCPVLPRRA